MTKKVYLFDVDGTLTPSRQKMNSDFENWFYQFSQNNDVFLISGSDRPKTLDQVGQRIYDSCLGVYQCNGNEHWYRNRRVKSNGWKPSYEFRHFLENKQHHSKYHIKTGNHIEIRTGMVNFSTIGRDANQRQREAYYDWDLQNKERENIADEINRKFPELNATLGGQISIDIYPKGSNKAQVLKDFENIYDEIIFFGDRTEFGGNDYPLALVIELGHLGKVYKVEGWQHTWELLKEFT